MITRYDIFVKVIEAGSFTQAAAELGYSQSAVSQTVRSLEKEFQTTLIHRGHDGLHLSEDGKAYYSYILALVKAEQNLEEKKKEKTGLLDETVRIGTITSVSRNLLPLLIQKFHAQYTHVNFALRQGDYDEIHEWIKNGSVDFGFLNPEYFNDLNADIIYRDTMVAVLPKDHPLAAKKSVSLKDMAKEEFILLDEGKNSVPLKAFAAHGLQPHLEYTIYDDYSILAMIRQGMGVSILYRLVVNGFTNGLVMRPMKEPIERPIACAYVHKEEMSLAATTFLQYVMQETPHVIKQMGMDKGIV